MYKLSKIILIISLFFNSTAFGFGYDDEQKIMAKFSLTKEKVKFYISYENQEELVAGRSMPELKLNLFTIDKSQDQIMNYGGYRNVEGYKNTKRKQDVEFASTVVLTGLLIVTLGVGAVVAIVNAAD